VYHYLTKVASGQPEERRRGFAHRIVRNIVEIWQVRNVRQLRERISEALSVARNSYDGEKMPPRIQTLKGMIREFEEELVWAYFGMTTDKVHHMRLGFYTGDIFSEKPDRERDVEPILRQLRNLSPTVISLAFDPEGSGPDTHYKVLQAIAEAIREWRRESDLSSLRIWGYRNVWYQFHPAEVTHIVPVSLNAMGVMHNAFVNSYLSQVDASFPSYRLDGTFSDLSKQIWVDQLKAVQLLLGKPFFYQNQSARMRTTHGLLFFREMGVDEFLSSARELEKSMDG
jgi:glucosamine-6-phosphate deaminase